MATVDQTFSVGERSGKHAGQGSSRTFFASRKVRKISVTWSCALSCGNVAFLKKRVDPEARGINKRNVMAIRLTAVSTNKSSP